MYYWTTQCWFTLLMHAGLFKSALSRGDGYAVRRVRHLTRIKKVQSEKRTLVVSIKYLRLHCSSESKADQTSQQNNPRIVGTLRRQYAVIPNPACCYYQCLQQSAFKRWIKQHVTDRFLIIYVYMLKVCAYMVLNIVNVTYSMILIVRSLVIMITYSTAIEPKDH